MTTYEWLAILLVLIAGIWKLCDKLSKIEAHISKKVSYGDCAEQQEQCPCRKEVEELRDQINELHPRTK